MNTKTVQVLLVDDNDVAREAVRRAFVSHRIPNPLHEAVDGVEALSILRGTARRDKLERPFLILLDLQMPRMTGIELLRELRADPDLHDTVVFVLTTSRNEQDKVAAYDAHVAGYIAKEDTGPGFIGLVSLLDSYWRIVDLPEVTT